MSEHTPFPVNTFPTKLFEVMIRNPVGARLFCPSRVFHPRKYLGKLGNLRILDLGCGNHSPTFFKVGFPGCNYTGVDSSVYNNSPSDLAFANRLLLLDLEQTHLEDLPNGSFDLVVASHILEHLKRGVEILDCAIPKLREGGILFVAYPSPTSVSFPRMRGTLNFYDDPTHITLVRQDELYNLAQENGMQVVDAGMTRSPKRLVMMLLRVAVSPFFGGVTGPMFWDLYGFEEYFIAAKL